MPTMQCMLHGDWLLVVVCQQCSVCFMVIGCCSVPTMQCMLHGEAVVVCQQCSVCFMVRLL